MRIVIFPGDARQDYIARALKRKGYEVVPLPKKRDERKAEGRNEFRTCMEEIIRSGDAIVLPTPSFLSDGRIRMPQNCDWEMQFEELTELLSAGQRVYGSVIGEERMCSLCANGVRVIDLMESEEVALRNAVATAEGAIAEAIALGKGNMHDERCLVIGFGRCGSVLAHKLKGLCRSVGVMARRESVLTAAKVLGFETIGFDSQELAGYRYVFNTVPANVLFGRRLESLDQGVVIIDLASAPGGVDYTQCAMSDICAKLCSGLPGKYAPEASGVILAEAIERSFEWKE